MHRLVVVAVIALLLSACAPNSHTNVKNVVVDDRIRGLATGPDHRLITSSMIGIASRPGRVDPHRILCVEPSPDVARAVANQVTAALGIPRTASSSITSTQSEGLVQLAERTTTLQAILNQGYQACLDYSNGAITATTYALRQSRLDDLIATLVISEHASGGFGRSGASIATAAEGTARAMISGLAAGSEEIDRLQKELQETELAMTKKQQELDSTDSQIKVADELRQDTSALQTTRKAQKSQFDELDARRTAILRQLTTSADTLAQSAAEVKAASGIGGLTRTPDPNVAKVLGAMQESFVNIDSDRALVSICLTELGYWSEPDTKMDQPFKGHILDRVTNENCEPTCDRKKRVDIQRFFLGRYLGNRTLLTTFCQNNLAAFLQQSVNNRQALQLARLELEEKRLQVRSRTSATSVGTTIDHPLATYNRLVDAKATLDQRKTSLDASPVPAVNDGNVPKKFHDALQASKDGLTKEVDAILVRATAAIANKAAVTDIENAFISLIGDTRRSAPGPANDLWQAEFNVLRVKAQHISSELTRLIDEIAVLGGRINRLITQIESAK